MKKIVSSLLIVSLFPTLPVMGAGESCAYSGEYEECIAANASGSARTIESFECLESQNKNEIMFQIVLDKKFKEIDKDVKAFLKCLEENKSYFFGPNAQENHFQASDLISKVFWEPGELSLKGICLPTTAKSFQSRYKELCNGKILETTIACLGGSVASVNSRDFLSSTTIGAGGCMSMADYKLNDIYEPLAYNILKLNKMQVRRDDKKQFYQKRRSGYKDLIDMMLYNLGFIERIRKKWNVRLTRNVNQ